MAEVKQAANVELAQSDEHETQKWRQWQTQFGKVPLGHRSLWLDYHMTDAGTLSIDKNIDLYLVWINHHSAMYMAYGLAMFPLVFVLS